MLFSSDEEQLMSEAHEMPLKGSYETWRNNSDVAGTE